MTAYLKYIVHSSPLVPLLIGNYWLALAAVLAVGLVYIKVFKLETELLDCQNEKRQKEILGEKNRWLRLTFLKIE